jgi:hypothetical protein
MRARIYFADGKYLSVNGTDTTTSLSIGSDDATADIVHLLENFSSPYKPTKPTNGQLWFDNKNNRLSYYSGGWNILESITPTSTSIPEYKSLTIANESILPASAATKAYLNTKTFKFNEYSQGNVSYVIYPSGYTILSCVVHPTSPISHVAFPFTFTDAHYTVLLTPNSKFDNTNTWHTLAYEKTTSGFKVQMDYIESIACVVMGFKAK